MELIFSKMINVMREIKPIGKNQKNQKQGWKFRGIDDTYNALHELLAKEGILVKPEVLESEFQQFTSAKGTSIFRTAKRIKYTFVAEDGSEFVTIMDGEGMDYGDKSGSKAESSAQKYDLFQTFLIPTEDLAEPDKEVYESDGEKEIKTEKEELLKESDHDYFVDIIYELNTGKLPQETKSKILVEAKANRKNQTKLKSILKTMKTEPKLPQTTKD